MRSLSLLSCAQSSTPGHSITASTVNPDTNEHYIACVDGNSDYSIYSCSSIGSTPALIAVLAIANSPPFTVKSNLVSFHYLPENETICCIFATGDIILVNTVDGTSEVVGVIEDGVAAAAWSPDDELLVLVTGSGKVLEMTKDFDVLSEEPLVAAEFGEAAPVDVGWGSKQTQFHGSAGKSAATSQGPSVQAKRNATKDIINAQISISWRGDGAFFAISSLAHDSEERVARFYSRTAALQSTSELTLGLGSSLSWQPSGAIIAVDQIDGGQNKILFFERNGLRRYDFQLRHSNATVTQLCWNSDSTILAVSLTKDGSDFVQLWTRRNYYWYLKQEIQQSDVQSISWHPEAPLHFTICCKTVIIQYKYCWDMLRPHSLINDVEHGAVAVIDGSNIKLTPFAHQNVPPPMSTFTITGQNSQTPLAVSLSATDEIAALHADGSIDTYTWSIKGKNKASETAFRHYKSIIIDQQNYSFKKIAHTDSAVVVLATSINSGTDVLFTIHHDNVQEQKLPCIAIGLCISGSSVIVQGTDKTFYAIEAGNIQVIGHCREICPWLSATSQGSGWIIARSNSGRLYSLQMATNTPEDEVQAAKEIAVSCTSHAIARGFVIWTTATHEAKFLPIFSLSDAAPEAAHSQPTAQSETKEDVTLISTRSLERGSVIVTVIPSSNNLVLQMPRGNLETISPRPLVLQNVRDLLLAGKYLEAFTICRRQRVDLNLICDIDRQAFMQNIGKVIEGVKSEWIEIFVSSLRDEDVTWTMYKQFRLTAETTPSDGKVNTICAALRREMESKDLKGYANCILTTLVCQKPAAYEDALQLLVKLKAEDESLLEEAVKYIIFLADANKLFDIALGMYDFGLALLIAQNSQKDPREYIPFLRELRSLESHEQRYRIDNHLNKPTSALQNLIKADPANTERVMEFAKYHSLYDVAIKSYAQNQDNQKIFLEARGDSQMENKEYAQAAISFTLAHAPKKAMQAYIKTNEWAVVFAIATRLRYSDEEMEDLASEVAVALQSSGKHSDAARVVLEYGRDIEHAVQIACAGAEYAEALRMINVHQKLELISDIVVPSVQENQERLCEELEDIAEQVTKQTDRLAELRLKRESDPDQFYDRPILIFEDDENALDNVDLADTASTVAGTQYTRYTAAAASTRGSTVRTRRSQSSRRSTRKAFGSKNSIFEETYLLGSIARMFDTASRVATAVAATHGLTQTLIALSTYPQADLESSGEDSTSLLTTARELQQTFTKFIDSMDVKIKATWAGLKAVEHFDDLAQEKYLESSAGVNIVKEKEKRPAELEVFKGIARPSKWKVDLEMLYA